MASIRPRKNKNGDITSYTIIVSLGYSADGEKITETTTYKPEAKTPAKARKEVERFAALFEEQIRNGGSIADGTRIRFRDFIEIWDKQYMEIRARHGEITHHYRESSLNQLKRYAVPVIGHMKMSEIKAVHIDAIVAKMLDAERAPKTIRTVFNTINAIFAYAYRKQIVNENPCGRCNPLPKIKRGGELHYWTEEQVEKFLSDALEKEYLHEVGGYQRQFTEDHKPGERVNVTSYSRAHGIPLQWKVYFHVAIYGGFRRGEMVALTWEDIDTDNQTITISKAITASKAAGEEVKGPKTEAGKRAVKLPAKCFKMLSDWKREQREMCLKLGTYWQGRRGSEFDKNCIFIKNDGSRMNIQTPSGKFRKLLHAYNESVPEPERLPEIRLHDLRHTNASHLVAAGVDIETVARRLGHSRPSFTLDVYGHAIESMDDKAADVLEQIFTAKAQ